MANQNGNASPKEESLEFNLGNLIFSIRFYLNIGSGTQAGWFELELARARSTRLKIARDAIPRHGNGQRPGIYATQSRLVKVPVSIATANLFPARMRFHKEWQANRRSAFSLEPMM